MARWNNNSFSERSKRGQGTYGTEIRHRDGTVLQIASRSRGTRITLGSHRNSNGYAGVIWHCSNSSGLAQQGRGTNLELSDHGSTSPGCLPGSINAPMRPSSSAGHSYARRLWLWCGNYLSVVWCHRVCTWLCSGLRLSKSINIISIGHYCDFALLAIDCLIKPPFRRPATYMTL